MPNNKLIPNLKMDASVYNKCIKSAGNLDLGAHSTKFYIAAGKKPDHIIKLFKVMTGDGCDAMKDISTSSSSKVVYKIYREKLIPVCFVRIHFRDYGFMSYAGGYLLKDVPLLSISTKHNYVVLNGHIIKKNELIIV